MVNLDPVDDSLQRAVWGLSGVDRCRNGKSWCENDGEKQRSGRDADSTLIVFVQFCVEQHSPQGY